MEITSYYLKPVHAFRDLDTALCSQAMSEYDQAGYKRLSTRFETVSPIPLQ
ncbi:MAG: hypothetical protein JO033_07320 [Acidobacteriaceae bacterium]|nr:hypothetical protein [Acidobacteriaceae bacterium]